MSINHDDVPAVCLGILGECDAPRAESLCLCVKLPGRAVPTFLVQYLTNYAKMAPQFRKPFEFEGTVTPIGVFGVEMTKLSETEAEFTVVGESRATYRDGLPRRWQGHTEGACTIRLEPKAKFAVLGTCFGTDIGFHMGRAVGIGQGRAQVAQALQQEALQKALITRRN